MTNNDTDTARTKRQDSDEKDTPALSVCGDCSFLEATKAESLEGLRETGEDPALQHHQETNHECMTVEPTDGSELHGYWETLFKRGDWTEVPNTQDLWEIVRPQGAEA